MKGDFVTITLQKCTKSPKKNFYILWQVAALRCITTTYFTAEQQNREIWEVLYHIPDNIVFVLLSYYQYLIFFILLYHGVNIYYKLVSAIF